MYSDVIERRVRYGETDQMGVLYYGFYAWYYEVGRVEALRALGVVYKEMEEEGYLLVVREMHSKFIRSAHYDDLMQIKTIIPTFPRLGLLTFETEIEVGGDLIHKAEVKLICINSTTRVKTRLPQTLVDALSPYFEKL